MPLVWSILIVGIVFSTVVVGVPDCVVTICGLIGFRLIKITLLLDDVTMVGGFLPVALAVPMTTGRVVSLASDVVNKKFCGETVALDIAVTTGNSVGEVTILLTGMSCLLAVLDALSVFVGLVSMMLPSLSANRMGKSRMPERSADVFAVESFGFTTATVVGVVVNVLVGAEDGMLWAAVVAGTIICWLLIMIFLFGLGVMAGWIMGAVIIGDDVWMG